VSCVRQGLVPKAVLIAGLVVGAFSLVGCGSTPTTGSASTPNATTQVASCSRLLSTTDAAQLVGASSLQMQTGPANTPHVVSPTANCEYDTSNGGPGVAPNLTNSFSFELWTNQTSAAAIYSGLESSDMNPYGLPACDPVPVQGIGEQAVWSGGSACSGRNATGFLLVQSNTSNLFILWGLQLDTSTTEAQQIVIEMGGQNSSGGSAASTSTTTVPPTTTTTTTPLTPEQQKYVDDIESQFPGVASGISTGPGNITVASLGNAGQAICARLGSFGVANDQQNYISVYATTSLPDVDETVPNKENIVSLAIEDICPMYLIDIPPGDPGAS
jgi:hypothetical protein